MSMEIPLSEIVSNIITIMSSDVVHAGTASTIHMSAAHTNMAIMRCCIGFSPSIPNHSVGNIAIATAMIAIAATLMYRLYLRRNRMNRLNGVDCSIIVNSLILC